MTRQEIIGEIEACKLLLNDSDYSILKTLEGMIACTSATGIITYLKEITDELRTLKDKRQAWRDRINDLEAQLAALPEETTDSASTEASPDDRRGVRCLME